MIAEKLEKLNALKEKGILTQEEFEKQKKELLSDDNQIQPQKENTIKSICEGIIKCIVYILALFSFPLICYFSGVGENESSIHATKNIQTEKQNKKVSYCVSVNATEKSDNLNEKEVISKGCKDGIQNDDVMYMFLQEKHRQSFCECNFNKRYQLLKDKGLEIAQKYLNTVAVKGILEADKCFEELIDIKKTKEIEKMVNSFNYCLPWCKSKNFRHLAFNNFPNETCLFNIEPHMLQVIQQTDDGTLVTIPWANLVYLINTNEKDSRLVDNDFIIKGTFFSAGIYTYTNTLGAKRTVHKLNRIE